MIRARFAFAAHPDAIRDLRELPDDMRDLALLELQGLVHGKGDCLPLQGRLAGYHKVYVDPVVQYRMVIQFRDAPATSNHQREIYLVAAGSRKDYAVYRTAQLRTGAIQKHPPATAAETRVQAALSRSPHATTQQMAAPVPPATDARPAAAPLRKVPQR
ncbi:hypothetical protein ACFU5Z_16385 [Streptomyces sp. NPDC057521]|uniref:hypothetical protein n=1 Tax=Streptomyces sp. NPDC057521 TaxID=3346156 RepID=UPI0036CF9368